MNTLDDGNRRECKPSSVRDGHLSRPQSGRSRRRLRDCSRLPASASNLIAADSEIAAGRIALFSPPPEGGGFGLCCSHRPEGPCRSGLSTRSLAPPWLSPGTHALCSSDFPLARNGPATIHPDVPSAYPLKRYTPQPGAADPIPWIALMDLLGEWCRRGDLNSHEVTLTTP